MGVNKGFTTFAIVVTIILLIIIGLIIIIFIADMVLAKNNKNTLNKFDVVRNYGIKKRTKDDNSLAYSLTSVNGGKDKIKGGCGKMHGCGDLMNSLTSLTYSPRKFLQ